MRNTIAVVTLLLIALLPSVVSAADPHKFLWDTYGWTIDRKLVSGIDCPPGQTAFPKGKTVEMGVCVKDDRAFRTLVYWHRADIDPQNLRQTVFKTMAGGASFNESSKENCKDEAVTTGNRGVIKDCVVSLWNGTFYASFYHFEAEVPNGFSNETIKMKFTIWVQNAGFSTKEVERNIRSYVNGIQMAPAFVPVSSAQDELRK